MLQGKALSDIDGLPEIIGADDEGAAVRATRLFLTLGRHKRCFELSTVEAELAKLFLNTYRYTLFGLANEFALAAEEYGADVHAILEAANADYVRGGVPRPGPSRGPCLSKDTTALAYGTPFGLIAQAALKTHANVVLHVVTELRSALGSLSHRKVSVLGFAFKADTSDDRDNLTEPLVNLLDREGATTAVYDPLVEAYADPSPVRGSDALVLMTAHAPFRQMGEDEIAQLCARAREEIFVFDLWNVWPWADRIFGEGRRRADVALRSGPGFEVTANQIQAAEESGENSSHRSVRVAHAAGRSAPD
jgi:UDP-N-acetyl-D-mannosaminuronic acid dehydrogenase